MPLKTRALIALMLNLVIFPVTVFSQNRIYEARRIEGKPPVVDGIIEETEWGNVAWAGDFTQYEPYNGKPPSQLTRFRILYDDANIYVAIRAFDSVPSKIVKRLTRRDHSDSDWVGFVFDSYDDNRTGFGFSVTAAGVKGDLIISNDGQDDNTWDAIWDARCRIDDEGWTAEFRIPLSQLRFGAAEEMSWGLNVFRYVFRKQELSIWQAIPRDAPGFISYFGDLKGLNGIKPRKDIELLPYLLTKAEYSEKEDGNPYATGHRYKTTGGLDGKIAITNDLTLNFTINPDFGQVEADPSEVNLTAYETFFPEKRPFFIEGKNIFEFNMTGGDGDGTRNMLFYSRRIGRFPHFEPELADNEYADIPVATNILGSFKLSGKTRKGLSVGVLESLTSREFARVSANGTERKIATEPLTNYFIGRIQQDYGKGNSMLGGIFTATNRFINDDNLNYLPASAYTGGIDYRHFWKQKTYYWSVKGNFSHISGTAESIRELQESSARYFQSPDKKYVKYDPLRKSLSGHAGTFEVGKMGNGHYNFLGWLTWRSPGVDFNDVGYMRIADEIQQVFWVGYREYEPKGIFKQYGFNFSEFMGMSFGGDLLYRGVNPGFYATFKNFWHFNLNLNYEDRGLDRSELRGGPSFLIPGGMSFFSEISSDERNKLQVELGTYHYFGNHNYSYRHNYFIEFTYRPFNALSVSLAPEYFSGFNNFQYVTTESFKGEDRYILSGIETRSLSTSIRLNYSITPDLSIQYYGQPFLFSGKYKDFKRITNPRADNYVDRFARYIEGADMTWNSGESVWQIDEDRDGTIDYSFNDEDFNFMQFRSNLVIRWEYKTGAALYLVWSQGRTHDNDIGQLHPQRDFKDLFSTHPNDIFLLKFSYIVMF